MRACVAADASQHPYRLAPGGNERPERAALLAGMTRLCGQVKPDLVLLSRLQRDFLRLAVLRSCAL